MQSWMIMTNRLQLDQIKMLIVLLFNRCISLFPIRHGDICSLGNGQPTQYKESAPLQYILVL